MCTEKDDCLVPYTDLTRRNFAALAASAAATGFGLSACAQAAPAQAAELDVNVTTPDGTADAALFAPAGGGTHPGVLLWPDAGGLRPAMRDMGRRMAANGYVVLVVNPYYRAIRADAFNAIVEPTAKGEARNQARATMTPEAIDRDAVAFVRYLDGLRETSNAKIGTQGYCMGGPLTFRTAAAMPDRVGAVGSFHGGGLVTDMPDSPHLLVGKTRARFLVCIAQNDDARQPEQKTALRQAFAAVDRPATVEVYKADHGWCAPDSQVYDQAEAERAWDNLVELYGTALV